jgi:probable phosphoglycerate mutase
MSDNRVTIFAIRHGETTWSLTGQHTGLTDIPLTENGRQAASRLRPILSDQEFSCVLVSPLRRARETCRLSGLEDKAIIDPDLIEWNYGQYEGLTASQIQQTNPDWMIFRDGCPGGETPQQVGIRVERIIARARSVGGKVALFAHGHVLRVLAVRWIGLRVEEGQHFLLNTGTVSVLAYYQDAPAIGLWNASPDLLS